MHIKDWKAETTFQYWDLQIDTGSTIRNNMPRSNLILCTRVLLEEFCWPPDVRYEK